MTLQVPQIYNEVPNYFNLRLSYCYWSTSIPFTIGVIIIIQLLLKYIDWVIKWYLKKLIFIRKYYIFWIKYKTYIQTI